MKIYNGDCLDIMKDFQDKSFDCILADLPYGTTSCEWDIVIPMNDYISVNGKMIEGYDNSFLYYYKKFNTSDGFDLFWTKNHKKGLWSFYERIIKDNGVIILFGSQPFTSYLAQSNKELFRYELIWEKGQGTNYALCKKMPLKAHENILIFYKKLPTYNPQMVEKSDDAKKRAKRNHFSDKIDSEHKIISKRLGTCDSSDLSYPKSVQFFKSDRNNQFKRNIFHPTQKPLPLVEWLIKTYTNEGDLVLDNTMGGGTTGIACKNNNRDFVGIELDPIHFTTAKERLEL